MPTYDEAREELIAIARDYPLELVLQAGWSEADTRAKLVTRILTRVLGWPESCITRETKTQAGFMDYLLQTSHRLVVVEAKRSGKHFIFPIEKRNRRYALDGLKSEQQSVGKAIRQVREYADEAGIEYACATNGAQWIVFRAITRGKPWHSGKGVVFRSLEDVAESFVEFWNLLSFSKVQVGSLRREFASGDVGRPDFQRLSADQRSADSPLQRNVLSSQIQPIVDGIFRDLVAEDKLHILEKCYVPDRRVQALSEHVHEIFADTIPAFAARAGFRDLVETSTGAGRLEDEYRAAVERGDYGTTILLLGGVGSGKTTFIHRFLRLTDKKFVEANCLWFSVPFTNAPLNPAEFGNFVRKTVIATLRERYPQVDIRSAAAIAAIYQAELSEMETGLWADLSEADRVKRRIALLERQIEASSHCDAVLKHIRRKGFAVTMVLDNVDQRIPEEQIQIFLLAHELCKSFDAIIIVALREESYFRAAQAGAFNAYHNTRFHIASPNVSTLLRKRVTFALELSRRGAEEMREVLRTGASFSSDEVTAFLHIVSRISPDTHGAIARFIDAVSYGNMRLALEMFTQFMVSGATNVERMLEHHRQGATWTVSEHEFIKAVMLGDFQFYRDSRSRVPNVFEVSSGAAASNLTQLRILRYLEARRSQTHPEGMGFVPVDAMLRVFADAFGSSDDAEAQTVRLAGRKLLELDGRQVDGLAGSQAVRITAPGMYFLNYLCSRFVYLDLIAFDTPVWHHETIHHLRRLAMSQEMYDRIERVEWFINYLQLEEQRPNQGGMGAFVRDAFGTSISERLIEGYRINLERVVSSGNLDRVAVQDIRLKVRAIFAPSPPP